MAWWGAVQGRPIVDTQEASLGDTWREPEVGRMDSGYNAHKGKIR